MPPQLRNVTPHRNSSSKPAPIPISRSGQGCLRGNPATHGSGRTVLLWCPMCKIPILFDVPLVSVLYFAESASEIIAVFHTMASSCQREAWGNSWEPLSQTSHTGACPSLGFSFPQSSLIWNFKTKLKSSRKAGGNKSMLFFFSPHAGLDSRELFSRSIPQAPVRIYKGELFLPTTVFWMHSVYVRRRRLYWEHSELDCSGKNEGVDLWILFWNLSYSSSLRCKLWEPWELIALAETGAPAAWHIYVKSFDSVCLHFFT